MTVLMGGSLLCLVVLIRSLLDPGDASSPWLAAGALAFLLGTLAPTVLRHVPLNDRLATADPHGADAADRWRAYAVPWTRLNHLRAAAGAAATALLTVAVSVG